MAKKQFHLQKNYLPKYTVTFEWVYMKKEAEWWYLVHLLDPASTQTWPIGIAIETNYFWVFAQSRISVIL